MQHKCHNCQKSLATSDKPHKSLNIKHFGRAAHSLPFTRGSAAAGNVSVKVIPEDEAKPVIEYIRVSTQQQGKSGLGLEAQRKAISRFAEAEGFDIVETFVEIESTKGDTLARRPKLQKALAAAKRIKDDDYRIAMRRSSSRSSTGSRATLPSSRG